MAKVAELELVDILRRVEVFSGLTDEQLTVCARNLQKSEYKKSKWVFKQGEVGDRFYIIKSGTAEVIRSSDGYEELLSELGEGQFFGERSLLQQEPRFASIRATSQLLRTLSISKGAFEEVLGPLESLVKTVEYKKSEIPALVQQRKTLKRQGTMGNLGKGLTQIAAPVIRRHKPQRVGETQKAKPLFDSAGASRGKHATFEDIVKADAARKELLSLARNNSPIQSVGRLSTLPRTVIPRILRRFPTWLVLIVYVISCIACRLGLDFGDLDLVLTAFESSNTLITFMIIFYVGYCYTRYEDQFKDVENMMHAIIDACVMARVAFRDPDEVLRLWRYLNLVHISAYTGLTIVYTVDNFFTPLCRRHGLQPKTDDEIKSEKAASAYLADGDGAAAALAYQLWAYEVLQTEAFTANSRITPPIHARLNEEIRQIGLSAKRLHTYTYQVLPFIYTHLVSLMCTLFLLFNAFYKGFYFSPGASFTFGIILPLCSVLTATLAVFGLLEVGDTILDPFGADPEDFTVLHFIEWTISSSLAAIQLDSTMPPERERKKADECYSQEETLAMVMVVSRMVARFRARKAAREQLMAKSIQNADGGGGEPAEAAEPREGGEEHTSANGSAKHVQLAC